MSDFYDFQGIFDIIKFHTKEVFFEIMEELTHLVKEELKKNWYDTYIPKAYERTYELLRAITWVQTLNDKDEMEFEIFYDESRIVPDDGTNEKPWTIHRNITDGKDFITGLTEVMEHANPSKIYGWEESQAPKPFTIIDEFIKDYLRTYFLKEMRKRGFTITEEENKGIYGRG
jgi:hypothetical protein